MHRAPVEYPATARSKGVQGVVIVELTFDANGNVADARVLSGPEELRKAALSSTLQWHFSHEAAGNKRQVTIAFQLPAPAPAASQARTPDAQPRAVQERAQTRRTIKSINIYGVSEQAKSDLMSRLSLRVGSTMTASEALAQLDTVREYDEHLKAYVTYLGPDEMAITIQASTVASAITDDPHRLKIGGNQQSTKLIRQPRPVYPPDAKAARVQGLVKLLAVIGKDGTVQQLEVISGHPLLVPSALDAVRQWVYEPTLLNGNPVDVQTQIDVNYTLAQ
jgi:TonB family protein